MWSTKQLLFLFLAVTVRDSVAQSVASFPAPDTILADVKHKEPKSGVQLGAGNTLTIQSGVGTPTTINVLAFSKDSKLLAAGKDFGRVVVWDVPNRKFLRAVDTGQGIITAVALSPNGQLMVTGGQGDRFSLKQWDLRDGKLMQTYNHFNGYVKSATFGPAGTWIVVWDNFGETRVLDIATGKQLVDLKDEYAPLLSSRGDTMVTVSKASFTLWSTPDWTRKRTLPRPPDNPWPLALNAESDSLVTASPGAFRLLRLSTGEASPSVPKPELPKFNLSEGGFAAFGNDNLLFGHSGGRLWVWNIGTGQTCVSDPMYSASGSLSPDATLLTGAKDNSIFAQTRTGEGVWVWDTSKLVAKCLSATK